MPRTLIGSLLCLAIGSTVAGAQDKSQLIGKIYDSRTGQVLTTALVELDGGKANINLSSQARFVLSGIEPGDRRILIRAVGYRPFTGFLKFEAGKTVEKTFELEFTGDQMPDLEVEARNSKTLPRFVEFERRRDRGVGHFIARDEISARGYMSMGDALRSVIGVKVYCDVLDCRVKMARAAPGCLPAYYVDGQLARSFATTTPINDVQGIEIYRGAGEIPAEFTGSGAGCGVVVIWTRSTP